MATRTCTQCGLHWRQCSCVPEKPPSPDTLSVLSCCTYCLSSPLYSPIPKGFQCKWCHRNPCVCNDDVEIERVAEVPEQLAVPVPLVHNVKTFSVCFGPQEELLLDTLSVSVASLCALSVVVPIETRNHSPCPRCGSRLFYCGDNGECNMANVRYDACGKHWRRCECYAPPSPEIAAAQKELLLSSPPSNELVLSTTTVIVGQVAGFALLLLRLSPDVIDIVHMLLNVDSLRSCLHVNMAIDDSNLDNCRNTSRGHRTTCVERTGGSNREFALFVTERWICVPTCLDKDPAPSFVATGMLFSIINELRCDECGVGSWDSIRISDLPQCQDWHFLCGRLPCYGASDSPHYACKQDDSVELSVCHHIYAHIVLSECVLPFSFRDTLLTSPSSIKLELPSTIIVRMRASLSPCMPPLSVMQSLCIWIKEVIESTETWNAQRSFIAHSISALRETSVVIIQAATRGYLSKCIMRSLRLSSTACLPVPGILCQPSDVIDTIQSYLNVKDLQSIVNIRDFNHLTIARRTVHAFQIMKMFQVGLSIIRRSMSIAQSLHVIKIDSERQPMLARLRLGSLTVHSRQSYKSEAKSAWDEHSTEKFAVNTTGFELAKTHCRMKILQRQVYIHCFCMALSHPLSQALTVQTARDKISARAELILNTELTDRTRRLTILKFDSILTRANWIPRARLSLRRLKRCMHARLRHLAATKLQRSTQHMLFRRNCVVPTQAMPKCESVNIDAVQTIQHAARLYRLNHQCARVPNSTDVDRTECSMRTFALSATEGVSNNALSSVEEPMLPQAPLITIAAKSATLRFEPTGIFKPDDLSLPEQPQDMSYSATSMCLPGKLPTDDSHLRMDAAAQTRDFLTQYDYGDSLTMRLYQNATVYIKVPPPSLPVYKTDARRHTKARRKNVVLSESEKLWRQAYTRTQMDSAVATEAAWQSVKSLIGSADSSACNKSTVPIIGFPDSPTCYRPHSVGDLLATHEPVFLGLELGMPATEIKHRQNLEYYFELNCMCTAPARRNLYGSHTLNFNRNHFNWFSSDQLEVQLILARFGKLSTVKMTDSVPNEFVHGTFLHEAPLTDYTAHTVASYMKINPQEVQVTHPAHHAVSGSASPFRFA